MASTSQKQHAADLQTELQHVKFNMQEMKEEEDMDIIEIRRRREKTILMTENKVVEGICALVQDKKIRS